MVCQTVDLEYMDFPKVYDLVLETINRPKLFSL